METIFTLKANFVDLQNNSIYPAAVKINNDRIEKITRIEGQFEEFIMPGFIDAHVHIESSMVTPYEFAKKEGIAT